MSDQQPNTPENASADQQAQQPLVVLGQYIKDLSFEVPAGAAIFRKLNKSPELPISFDVKLEHLEANVFEVALSFEIKGQLEGETAFILELVYAGIVQVNVAEESDAQLLLLIETPRILFPFARNLIADITRDGGFPPLMLQPIDFVQFFRNRMEMLQAQQAQNEAAPTVQ